MYAIIVYLITETLQQLKLSFCVSCRIYVISYQLVSTISLYINQYNNTCPMMTYLQMTFRLNESYCMRTTVLCSYHVWYV